MGYPVYKLIRAINRQYPNNGFINYVDVNENTTGGIIDEDLRDLINEAIHETYINIAKDEVFSFPTVAGQNQYQLPEDCDLRDIQEVTRTYRGVRGPLPVPPPPPIPPMPPVDVKSEVIFMINKTAGSFVGGEDMVSEGTTYSIIKGEVDYGESVNFVPNPTLVSGYNLIGWADSTVPEEQVWTTDYIAAKPIVENTIFMAAVGYNIDPETIWEDVTDPSTEPYKPDAEEWDTDFNFNDDNVDPGLVWEDVEEQEGWDSDFNFGDQGSGDDGGYGDSPLENDDNDTDPSPVWD